MSLTASLDYMSRKASAKAGGKLEFTETFTIKGATSSTTSWQVMGATGLPQVGDLALTSIGGVYIQCTAVDVYETGGKDAGAATFYWKANVRYESGGGMRDPRVNTKPQQNVQDPLSRPVIWRTSYIRDQQIMEYCPRYEISGTSFLPLDITTGNPTLNTTKKAIFNSANDPIKGLFKDKLLIQFTATNFIAAWTPAFGLNYIDHINEYSFLGFQKYYVKCLNITAEDHYENGIGCVAMTYEFLVNDEPWNLPVLDQGKRWLDKAGGAGHWKSNNLLDSRGMPVTEPQPLNGAGAFLIPDQCTETYIKYLHLCPWKTADFDDLDLI